MANIEIGGRLHSTATGNVVTGANEVHDDIQNKKQQEINAELIEAVGAGGSVDSRIAAAKAEIKGNATSACDTLGEAEALISAEATRAQAAEDDRYTKTETYSKTELNNMITTPNQEYVSVTATDQTTSVTDVLPATGAADTTYRVGNWDGTQYNDSVFSEYAWNGSAYIKLSTKSQVGEVYDISANHADTKYADLAAALGTDGANVPVGVRKGGMSVKYVQSSDNNYIRYNLLATSFTTDTTQWAVDDNGVYVENPEFVNVKTDKDGKILWAIKADGGIYYGAGVPQQVIDYINEKIAELSLDEYEDIVAFLNGIEEGDKTLQMLLNEKVDKVEGKSLINAEYASTKSTIDNPEYLKVTTDSEDKVLEGIQADGTKVIGGDLNVGGSANLNGDLRVLGNMEVSGVSYKVIENPEYLAAWVDAEDKVIFGLKADGKTYVGDADFLNDIDNIKAFLANITDKNIDWDALSSITTAENPEYIEAKTDSEGKILAGRTDDGAAFENVGFSTPRVSIDGHTIKNIEDPEGRSEITTDSEGKIISYRDGDGVKHENTGIETDNANINHLNLTDTGMTEFQQALKDAGFNPGGAGDWSDAKDLQIPIPRCASINIVVDDNIDFTKLTKPNKEGAEEGVTIEVPAIVEFCDMQGNYFKKHALIQGQGTSSLAFDKRNFAFDFFNEDPTSESFDEDNTFKITFGDWVACDSFHAKAYYTDFFRGISLISYQVANEVWKSRGIEKDRPWKKALINESDFDTRIHYAGGVNNMSLQIDNGARCIPDGFPAVIYRNGEFWGLYTFCLKKARENYHTIKNNPSHIHLDGELGNAEFWCGTVKWSAFEIRNPKKLVYAYNVFDVYDEAVSYKVEAIVCDADKKNAYFSKQSNNLGHPLTDTAYWGIASDNLYKYDADVLQAEIAGNADGSTVYSQWTAGNYAAGEIRSHTIDGISHLFMNTVADNDKEPIIQYDAEKDKWYNLDDDPDFKNKSKCGWINVTNTVKVKESIIAFSKVVPQIEAANTDEAKKALFESVFDTDNMIDYNITTNFLWNQDGFRKNWQWLTWDGVHWYACFYDMDCVYGAWHKGNIMSTNYSALIVDDEGGLVTPGHYPFSLYPTEVKARWSELVSKGILTQENVINKVKDWLLRYGENDFKKEWKKWPESPCNRDDNTVTEFWTRNNYKTTREASYISAGYTLWDANTTYSEGAKVVIGPIDKGYYYGFVAKNTEGNTGIYPITPYSDYPIALGLHDSIWRLNAYARRVSTNLSNLINGL